MQSKAVTFINFAVRARKICMGVNAAEALREKAYLLILCGSASENTKKQALKIAKRKNCVIIESKELLSGILNKENCKLAAVLDKNLAQAVMDNLGEEFIVINSEK